MDSENISINSSQEVKEKEADKQGDGVKSSGKSMLLAALLGWLIPGAGHLYLGKQWKALFFFMVLVFTYLTGLYFTGFRTVSWGDNQFYYIGNYGSGATLFLGNVLSQEKAHPVEGRVEYFDVGLLYTCVAGLLNAVIVLSLYELAAYAYVIGIATLVIQILLKG
ncbi:MAG: hypothetical protein A2W23_02510 [Planctomycetes bacterium RBG_16_43_13]|nr:MAG: hypothetical protein A2W23_02510 [Planctomycetes bacterium RBG_16_43_13]